MLYCRWLLLFFSLLPNAVAYELVVDDPVSIRDVLQKVAFKMMQFYPGNKTGGIPGLFGSPYYWWEAGAAFGALVDYWWYTGDAGYNAVTTEALLHQVGPEWNYMPPNRSSELGNDDQAFWGLAAMAAAEKNFPDPPEGQPQWLSLAQAVFNTQAWRWEPETCGGGLRWQIFPLNPGYNYKNTVSNGAFFQLAARLARYTGNNTYMEHAVRTWDWTRSIGLISEDYRFIDGFDTIGNCTVSDPIQWTYNARLYLAGAAYLYNYTSGDPIWKSRIEGIVEMTLSFFPNDTLVEMACEPYRTCNIDQRSFKAYIARFMALTVKLAPFTAASIMPKLRSSAIAAARYCSFGEDRNTCGMRWTETEWDGLYGVGEQMSALEVIQSNMIHQVDGKELSTAEVGGTSKGNPAAGGDPNFFNEKARRIRARDKGGAAVLTVLTVGGFLAFGGWLSVGGI